VRCLHQSIVSCSNILTNEGVATIISYCLLLVHLSVCLSAIGRVGLSRRHRELAFSLSELRGFHSAGNFRTEPIVPWSTSKGRLYLIFVMKGYRTSSYSPVKVLADAHKA
jgi:hypothetical protein